MHQYWIVFRYCRHTSDYKLLNNLSNQIVFSDECSMPVSIYTYNVQRIEMHLNEWKLEIVVQREEGEEIVCSMIESEELAECEIQREERGMKIKGKNGEYRIEL